MRGVHICRRVSWLANVWVREDELPHIIEVLLVFIGLSEKHLYIIVFSCPQGCRLHLGAEVLEQPRRRLTEPLPCVAARLAGCAGIGQTCLVGDCSANFKVYCSIFDVDT